MQKIVFIRSSELGLISGDPNGRFNPNQPFIRAQASAIIALSKIFRK